MADSLSFISDICGALKKLKRTGWVKHSIPLPESDSDHMHRCAMCALLVTQPADPRDHYNTPETELYHPSKVDSTRLLRMAVTHDLLVGDPLGEELYGLWKEYEDLKTVEAIYCKDIDKFEMVVQAFEYEKDHLLSKEEVETKQKSSDESEAPAAKKAKVENNGDSSSSSKHADIRADVFSEPLRGFFVSTNSVIKTPLFRRLDKELRDRREKFLKEKGWGVTEDEKQKPLPIATK